MDKKEFSFSLISKFKKARLGKIKTPRGNIDTPAFMPVGTLGTVKVYSLKIQKDRLINNSW